MTPDLIYDQMIAGGVARKLVFSLARQPGRRRAQRHPPAHRARLGGGGDAAGARGVQPLRHGCRYTAGAANLPFMPLRSYFETDLPTANPLIRPDQVAVLGRGGLRGPAAQPGRDRDPRPARGRQRQHPDLGPAGLPEGGRLRRRPGDRGGGGAGRGVGHPRRPQPHRDPGPDRGCRGGGPLRRTSLLRPGLPTTATTASTSTGTRSAATRTRPQAWLREWVYDLPTGPPTSRRWAPSGGRASRPASAPSGSVDYGSYR